MDIIENKNLLRDRAKKCRAGIPASCREEMDTLVYRNILSLEVIKKTEWIYTFVSYGTEVCTIRLIDTFLKQPYHRVAVPRVCGEKMDFYEINSIDNLKPGCHGIPEPERGTLVKKCNGIMIMPGLVFDLFHGRIGYGGGYYDRYIAARQDEEIYKIAISYDFQVLKEGRIPMEPHDTRPDIIVTDKALY